MSEQYLDHIDGIPFVDPDTIPVQEQENEPRFTQEYDFDPPGVAERTNWTGGTQMRYSIFKPEEDK